MLSMTENSKTPEASSSIVTIVLALLSLVVAPFFMFFQFLVLWDDTAERWLVILVFGLIGLAAAALPVTAFRRARRATSSGGGIATVAKVVAYLAFAFLVLGELILVSMVVGG
jgi:drug/metabolite transporter (DMT)-like permease